MLLPPPDLFSREFGFEPETIRPLPEPGLENSGYIVEDPHGRRYLARFSNHRSINAVGAEAQFLQRIHVAGFHLVPSVVPNLRGHVVTASAIGPLLLYRFINGTVYPCLADRQFGSLIEELPAYFRAMTVAGREAYRDRPTFPEPATVGAAVIPLEPFDDSSASVADTITSLPPLDTDLLIHGDLHSRNLVWGPQNRLVGILDFDDSCYSCLLIEILALVRGVCFASEELNYQRYMSLLGCLRPMIKTLRAPVNYIAEYLVYVCSYFFVAVNRQRSWRPVSVVDDLDLRRAIWVLEHRREIAEIWLNVRLSMI